MKHFHLPFVVFASFVLALSCERISNEDAVYSADNTLQTKASSDNSFRSTHIGINEITNSIKLFHNLGERDNAFIKSIDPIVNGRDTIMYLANYEKGWELLSADTRAPRVLMMAENGNIAVSGLKFNPIQAELYENTKDRLINLVANPGRRDDYTDNDEGAEYRNPLSNGGDRLGELGIIVIDTLVIVNEEQDHLLETKWGQGYPWNNRAPYKTPAMSAHCLTGCTPVAIAQTLYYLHYKTGYPQQTYDDCTCTAYIHSGSNYVQITSSDISFANSSLSSSFWDDCPLTIGGGATSDYNTVSTLMVRLGYLLESKYYTNKTTTIFGPNILSVLYNNYSLYSSYMDAVNYDTIRDNVYSNELPVLMTINGNLGNHTVVVDGYKRRTTKYIYCYLEVGGGHVPYQTITDSYRMVAINWGWDGEGDIDYSGNTIWYNTDGSAWCPNSVSSFNEFCAMIYGFYY